MVYLELSFLNLRNIHFAHNALKATFELTSQFFFFYRFLQMTADMEFRTK